MKASSTGALTPDDAHLLEQLARWLDWTLPLVDPSSRRSITTQTPWWAEDLLELDFPADRLRAIVARGAEGLG